MPRTTNQISFEQPWLETVAQSYPEPMREPFLWLAMYVRDKLMRNLDALVEQARKHEFQTDKTNFSKIFRGKWNRDGEGNEVAPCVKLKTFIELVRALRDDDRVSELAGRIPFIMTPTAKMVWNFVDAKRALGRVNKFGIIVGETGTQKTEPLKAYEREHSLGCKWMEAPENGSSKEFVCTLAEKYGTSIHAAHTVKRSKIFQAVNEHQTIIVENVQSFYRPSRQAQGQPVFDLLRRLQDEKKCCVIMTFTPEFEKQLYQGFMEGYFEQFEGRAGGRNNFLRLPPYAPDDDIIMIAEAFGLKDPEQHLAELRKISREPGRIRRLFEDLQEAKIIAEEKNKPLTIGHVRMARKED
jgi:hypothetical protein